MTKPIVHAVFKSNPDDFVVTEIMPIAEQLSGTGEHLWLLIEKTKINTTHMVDLLSKFAKIPPSHIGYSGLKDRHAKTLQWFSLHLPNRQANSSNPINIDTLQQWLHRQTCQDEHINIHRHRWHNKKLHRGTHTQNHFNITLRHVIGEPSAINGRLQHIQKTGVPNFFGEQRFGRAGNNLAQADTYLQQITAPSRHPKKRPKNSQHALMISVVRSHVFNQILAQRLADGTWDKAIAGDVFNLDGTHSLFCADIDDTIRHRMTIGDIHPTAPLIGTPSKITATHHAHAIEQAILNHEPHQRWQHALAKLNIKTDRRALRMMVKDLAWHWQDESTLCLDFYLPTGSFATSVLDFLSQTLIDGSHHP